MLFRNVSNLVSAYTSASSGGDILPSDRTSDYWFDANVQTSIYSDGQRNDNVTTSGDSVGYVDDIAE